MLRYHKSAVAFLELLSSVDKASFIFGEGMGKIQLMHPKKLKRIMNL